MNVVVILFIIGLGNFYINTGTSKPFIPSEFGPVVASAASVFFAVFGYDAMSTVAEESTDGKKHKPKAIVFSLVIAMPLYVAATLMLAGMQNFRAVDPTNGFSVLNGVGLQVIAAIISVVTVLTSAGNAIAQ